MSWKQRALIAGVLISCGCGEAPNDVQTTHGAITNRKQYVSVPAYWNPEQSDFTVLSTWDGGNNGRGVKSVYVNLGCETLGNWVDGKCTAQSGKRAVAGGPGSWNDPRFSARMQALAPKVAQLQSEGIEVFGYVDYYANRPSSDIAQDIYVWYFYLYYSPYSIRLNGIFFDDADRTANLANALARAESWASYSKSILGGGRVIFNYGTTRPETEILVQCLANYNGMYNWFVTQENYAANYMAMDPWAEFDPGSPADGIRPGNSAWMNGYMPDHFINIVHDVDPAISQTSIEDMINQSRILNAGQIYFTNGQLCESCGDQCPEICNTFGHLAQNGTMNPGTSPIYNYIYDASAAEIAYYHHGGDSDPSTPAGACVAENGDAPE